MGDSKETDPRIVEVIRVFHRVASSTYGCVDEFARGFVSAILGGGYCQEGMFEDWPTPGLLAVLTAYLHHAPDGELDELVVVARAQLVSLIVEEYGDAMERATGQRPDTDFDYPTQLKTEQLRYETEVQ